MMDVRFEEERSRLAGDIGPVVGTVVGVAGTRHAVAEGSHHEAGLGSHLVEGLDNRLVEGPGTRPAGNEVAEVLRRPGPEVVGSPAVDRSLDYRKT